MDRLRALPEITDVLSDLFADAPQLRLAINRDRAATFGISPDAIDQTLDDAFGQRQVTQYFTQVNTYYVIEELLPELLGDPATLDKIYIRSPASNQMVPVSTFAGVVKVTWFTDALDDTPARKRRPTRQVRATPPMQSSVSACKPAG
jgi:HAE1 family hydrophobic/amphiphilic exporter-1